MSDYKPHVLPVLAGLIFNAQGEVLLARRRPELSNGGKWEFPGGKLQGNESPEACLIREIREELGLAIDVLRPFVVVNHPLEEGNLLLLAYLCRHCGGRLKLTDHDRVLWVKPEQVSRYPLSEADVPVAEKLAGESIKL